MAKKKKEQLYKLPNGTVVRLARGKQFPVDDPRQGIRDIMTAANERIVVIRVKDGHELWGYTEKDCAPI